MLLLLNSLCKVKPRFRLFSSIDRDRSEVDNTEIKQRFKFRQVNMTAQKCNNALDALNRIKSAVKQKELQLTICDHGVIIVPKYSLIIPVHDGLIQSQHVVFSDANATNSIDATMVKKSNDIIESDVTSDSANCYIDTETETIPMTVCSFYNRGSIHGNIEEREIDTTKLEALNKALLKVATISGDELMSSSFSGSPAQKMYKAFVMPRVNRSYRIEPVDISALRVAQQIELTLRQQRAIQAADYLRNSDKSVPVEKLQGPKELNPIILLLDNIRACDNVGNLFRTAETVGVSELITCGITPHPPHHKLNKTALGATELVPTRHVHNSLQAILELKAKGYYIVAMETTTNAVSYTEVNYPKNVVIVVGHEVNGIDPLILQAADVVTEIPMFGIKNSMNVSAAAPVVLFEILRQWKTKV